MLVSEIMTANPFTVHPDAPLTDAIALMQRIGCHHLPVLSRDAHLVAILSETDCRRALQMWNRGWDIQKLHSKMLVRAVMTVAPVVIEPDAPASEAARLMLANYIHCLPVMRGETLIGIITTSDVLVAFITFFNRLPSSGSLP